VDIDVLDKSNRTAADLAAENGKSEVAGLLAKYKVDASVRNDIHSATLDLTEHTAHQDGKDENTLHTASKDGNVDAVKSMLDRGADINARNPKLETSLHLATNEGKLGVMRMLLERGAEIDAHDKEGWTPLHFFFFFFAI
jgi:ankyrin repeat protein